MNQPEKLLQQYFGHASFRTGQKQAIDAILSGRDVLAVMPTGAGKSVCYQISALLLRGVTIVISPLISLMKDQVEALRQVGIPAAYVNSSITQEEFYHTVQMVQQGQCRILYVAPERLMTDSFFRLTDSVIAECRRADQRSLILRCKTGISRIDLDQLLYCEVLGRTAGHCAVPDKRHRAAGCHRAGRHPAAAAGTGALDRAFGARAVALFAQAAAAVRRGRQRRFLPH